MERAVRWEGGGSTWRRGGWGMGGIVGHLAHEEADVRLARVLRVKLDVLARRHRRAALRRCGGGNITQRSQKDEGGGEMRRGRRHEKEENEE